MIRKISAILDPEVIKMRMKLVNTHYDIYVDFWNNLCVFPHEDTIRLLEKYPEKINWRLLSQNPCAIEMLEANPNKINWENLSLNPEAIKMLEENPNKINWTNLSQNRNALHIINANLENSNANISWYYISKNPNTILLLEKYPEKINWLALLDNPNLSKAVHLFKNFKDCIINLIKAHTISADKRIDICIKLSNILTTEQISILLHKTYICGTEFNELFKNKIFIIGDSKNKLKTGINYDTRGTKEDFSYIGVGKLRRDIFDDNPFYSIEHEYTRLKYAVSGTFMWIRFVQIPNDIDIKVHIDDSCFQTSAFILSNRQKITCNDIEKIINKQTIIVDSIIKPVVKNDILEPNKQTIIVNSIIQPVVENDSVHKPEILNVKDEDMFNYFELHNNIIMN